MPVEERGFRCGEETEERGPAGVVMPKDPATRGRELRSVTCVREGAEPRGSVLPGREEAWRRVREGHRCWGPSSSKAPGKAEPPCLRRPATTGAVPIWRSECDGHDPTGEPRRETRTLGSEGRGSKRTYGSRTEHCRDSGGSYAPDPTGTAPDPTEIRGSGTPHGDHLTPPASPRSGATWLASPPFRSASSGSGLGTWSGSAP